MISLYLQQKDLSQYETLEGNLYVSKFVGLTLKEYIEIRLHICTSTHKTQCHKQCAELTKVAKEILKTGFMTLKDAFQLCSPTVKYNAVNARR